MLSISSTLRSLSSSNDESTDCVSGRYTRDGKVSISNTSARWEGVSRVITAKMSLGEDGLMPLQRREVLMKASFDLLGFIIKEKAKHTRRTGGSVLGVGKEQQHVVVPCPVGDIGFKEVVVEDAHTVACNGSHLHIVALGNERRGRKREYRSQKGEEEKEGEREKGEHIVEWESRIQGVSIYRCVKAISRVISRSGCFSPFAAFMVKMNYKQ